jgi:predicted nucleotidyltransferase
LAVVGIVAEYNPLHLGHLHQFEEIRREFGSDTKIVVLLAGSFVQRGEVALLDKYTRAQAAVDCGANLVLELPFPWCCSSAEFYARGAVSLFTRLGIIDVLSFGSESGDAEALKTAASRLSSPYFSRALLARAKEDRRRGHARLCEEIYREFYGDAEILTRPNNVLGLEYLAALSRLSSPITPHTVLRRGDYHTGKGEFPSASAIRRDLFSGGTLETEERIPAAARAAFAERRDLNAGYARLSNLSSAILAKFVLSPPSAPEGIQDCEGGLGERILKVAQDSPTLSELITRAQTAKYTNARIHRAIVHLYLGTPTGDAQSPPPFTRLLACDSHGRELLHHIKKHAPLPIVTKSADHASLPPEAMEPYQRAHSADFMHLLAMDAPQNAIHPLRRSPYLKK